MKTAIKQQKRHTRHNRVRAKVFGTANRPRLAVFKSNTGLSAQIIDDEEGVTLMAVSSQKEKGKTNNDRVLSAAKALAEGASKKKISKVVFDRGGFDYAGSIKTFAETARSAGLEF